MRTPLPAATAAGLSAVAFVSYALALPGTDAWPLAFVAFVPLALALRGQPPRRAVAVAMAGGFVGLCIGFSWLYGTLRVFGGLPAPLAALGLAALCVQKAGRFGVWGWLTARATRRGWPMWTSFVLAFVASELVYPLLFPWHLAVTVHGLTPLVQVAELGGPILVGLVVLLGSVAVGEVVIARLERRRVATRVVAAGLIAVAVAVSYGFARIPSVDEGVAAAPVLRIGVIQGNVPLRSRTSALETQLRLTKQVREQGAELVVWSESALSGSLAETRLPELEKAMGSRVGGPTLIQLTLLRPLPAGAGRPHAAFNSSLLIDEKGRLASRYDKQKLLMFGEYMPLGDVFPVLYEWSPNTGRFVPGRSGAPIVWGGRRITTLICYEDILPSLVNRMVVEGGSDLLVNQTNDSWFLDSAEPWIHLGLAKLRAIEHRRYLVRATNTGVSAIVDPVGRVVVQGGTFREEALLGGVRLLRGRTVYETIGDVPWWIGSLASIGMAFVTKNGVVSRLRRGSPRFPA